MTGVGAGGVTATAGLASADVDEVGGAAGPAEGDGGRLKRCTMVFTGSRDVAALGGAPASSPADRGCPLTTLTPLLSLD